MADRLDEGDTGATAPAARLAKLRARSGRASAGPAPPARSRLPRLDAPTGRLVSGLVLFAFVLTHFLNHALGLVSLEWMEAAQAVRRAVWRSAPGTALLYGAFALHVCLGLWRILRRTTWHMPLWEALQIGLGLAIPIWLLQHVIATRGMNLARGIDDTYGNELRIIWPANGVSQSALLLIVWVHATIGLHHWLKTKRWYAPAAGWFLGLAVLVPALALLGWIEAGRRLAAAAAAAGRYPWTRDDAAAALAMADIAYSILVALAIGAGVAILIAYLAARLGRSVTVRYSNGRSVKARPGPTLLEISRANGVPHASICGGRARCTTCRALVLGGAGDLPPPRELEARALARIGAPARVRLACQIRPVADIAVRLLVPLAEAEAAGLVNDPYRWGVERRITVMFADLRGFTQLSERLYAYDSVFLLNRYFEVMAGEIRRHAGRIDKFMGDGIMALFGVDNTHGAGARDAVMAARAMNEALTGLNEEFRLTLGAPLRMGIGIHTGAAILGRVGTAAARGGSELTALGDTVNIASRLESLTKDFGAVAVVSEVALAAAGLALRETQQRDIAIRGRREELAVHVVKDFSCLTERERPAVSA